MPNLFRRFLSDSSGATAIEYGLIAGLISVAIVTSLAFVNTRLSARFSAIAATLS